MFACEQEGVTPGLPVPRQGADRRLPAARRDAHDRARLRRLPRRVRGVAHVLPRPHVHRQPARLRGRAGDARGLRAGAARSRRYSRRSRCCAELLDRQVAPLPGVREIRQIGFMVAIELDEHPGRRPHRPPGHARRPRARRDRPPARRRRRADAAAVDLHARNWVAW